MKTKQLVELVLSNYEKQGKADERRRSHFAKLLLEKIPKGQRLEALKIMADRDYNPDLLKYDKFDKSFKLRPEECHFSIAYADAILSLYKSS